MRTKTREKIVEEDYGGSCTGEVTENESCYDKECPGNYMLLKCNGRHDIHIFVVGGLLFSFRI